MDKRLYQAVRERNTLWFWLAATATFGCGIGLLYWGHSEWPTDWKVFHATIKSIGATLVGTAAISVIWELVGK